MHRNESKAENSGFSKHGSVLVAVDENPNSKDELVDDEGEHYQIILISSTNQKFLFAFFDFFDLFLATNKCLSVIITGDINFPSTNWSNM